MNHATAETLLMAVQEDIRVAESELAGLRHLAAWLTHRTSNEMATARLAGMIQADAAAILLRERAPRTTLDLVQNMLARGFVVEGDSERERTTRLQDSLYSTMRRLPKRFVRVGPWAVEIWDGSCRRGTTRWPSSKSGRFSCWLRLSAPVKQHGTCPRRQFQAGMIGGTIEDGFFGFVDADAHDDRTWFVFQGPTGPPFLRGFRHASVVTKVRCCRIVYRC